MSVALNPFLFFRRNLARTLPTTFVIVIAVVLVASVVSIVHSVDLTVYTLYGYNRYLTGLTPRNSLAVPDRDVAAVERLPDLGPLFPAHSYSTLVKTIFGKMPLPVFGLDAAGRATMMERCGVRLVSGRMPAEGEPEAVISDDVARNLGVRIGGVLFDPDSPDSYAPVPIRLVGLLRGPVWLGLTSKSLVDAHSPFSYTGYLAFSRVPGDMEQRRLDAEIARAVNPGATRVWKYSGLVAETRSALSNLYLILNLVIGIIVFAISFVCGLLSNIYFTQRLPEVATLSAIGYPRSQLLRRALADTCLLCALGWSLGVGATVLLLAVVRSIYLSPRGLLLNALDPHAISFTLPLPIAITAFAFVTIALRLATLDPVSIIERRG
jgi:ABC-type antimicrobial peptide transport system permease subunit